MGGRRNSFGTIISVGTPAKREFAIRWWEGTQRRQQGGFETKKKAAEGLARVRITLGDGTLAEKRKGNVSFDFVGQQFLRLVSAGLESHASDENYWRLHLKPFFKDTPMRAITPTRLLEFRAHIEKGTYTVRRRDEEGKVRDVVRPHSDNTQKLMLALLRRILNFAVEHDYLTVSPIAKLGRGKYMKKFSIVKQKNPIEDPNDVWRVLSAIKDLDEERGRQLYPFYALLVMSGLRRGEALGLRWDDLDFGTPEVGGTIHVQRTMAKKTTKGKKERFVPLHPDLLPILKAHKLADPWNKDLVFPSPDGEMYSEDAKVQNALHEALRRCGLKRVRLHDLRHVFASHFMEGGGDVTVLQAMLGHSTSKLTIDSYVHLSPRFLKNEITRVAFRPPAGTQIVREAQISMFAQRSKKPEKPE